MPLIRLHSRTNRSLPLISQPCRFRRAVKSASFPSGEAKDDDRKLFPSNEPLCPGYVRADFIRPYNCGGRAADGSAARRPIQLVYPNRFLSGGLPGGLRASTYAYRVRSVIVRRHCRPGRVLLFLSGELPGGLGHQRMRTILVALLSGGTAAKKGSGECLTPLLWLFRTFRCCRNDCRRNNCGNRC